MIWLLSEYLGGADETIQTVIVGDDRVFYVHYCNGYHSVIEGVNNLMHFLNGDVSRRMACFDTEDETIDFLEKYDR